jgi:predicted nucleotidyltransferase
VWSHPSFRPARRVVACRDQKINLGSVFVNGLKSAEFIAGSISLRCNLLPERAKIPREQGSHVIGFSQVNGPGDLLVFDVLPKEKIAQFCKQNHIRWLALFGSALREDFSADSDLDVLVEFESEHTPGLAFFTLEQELSDLLGRKVDLNTPRFISPYFREQVLKEAQVQYVAA